MRTISALFLFAGLHQLLYAATTPEDSLRKLLDAHQARDTVRVNLLLQYADKLQESDPDKEFKLLTEARDISRSISFPSGEAKAEIDIGLNILAFQYRLEEVMGHFMKALKIAEQIRDSGLIIRAREVLGGLYYQQGKFTEAEAHCLLALDYYERTGNTTKIADVLSKLGMIYDDNKNYGDAWKVNMRGLEIAKHLNNKRQMAVFTAHIGSNNYALGKKEQAIDNYKQAISLFEEIGNFRWTAYMNTQIAEIYAENKDAVNALMYAERAMVIARRINSKKEIMDSYNALSSAYIAAGDYKKGYEYHIKHKNYEDSLNNAESLNSIARMQNEYEKQKLEMLQQAELTRKEQQAYYYIAGGLVLLLLAAGLFTRLRLVRRTKLQLLEKNRQIVREKEIAERERLRAEESERFKQQFLANMSHEIRTPMNGVMGMTNVLLEKNPMPGQVKLLNTIKKSSENLLVIVNDILDLSKIEAGKMELEEIDYSLRDVVDTVNLTLQHKVEEKGLLLEIDYDSSIPEIIIGDPTRVNQILINIMGNAIKFTERGFVKLKVSKHGPQLQFTISDSGIGMTREQRERVFEAFQQAEKDTSRKFGGTGLGLSISKKLIELQGGTIEVESERGAGTTFYITIPYKVSSSKAIHRQETSVTAEMLGALHGIRILLAEDNEYNREVAIETLNLKLRDIEIDCAVNGAEVIDKLQKRSYDLVLMDVQMPILDGYETTRKIRTELHSGIPVLALTASVIRSDISKCLEAGMNGYVPKPFKTYELFSAMANVLKGKGNKKAAEVKKVTDLSFLKEFCESDEGRMKKYIRMYLDSAPKSLETITRAFDRQDYSIIQKTVHQLKAHLRYMGMSGTAKLADEIEQSCAENTGMDRLQERIALLEQECRISFGELA